MVEGGEANNTIKSPDVVTKYQTASEIVNRALKQVVEACKSGASIYEICLLGDKAIEDGVAAVYNKKKVAKGLAFPTSVNVDHIICHYSPAAPVEEVTPTAANPNTTENRDAPITLKAGNLVKIEMGAHIDGFPAMVATTIIVPEASSNSVASVVNEKQANVILAAKYGLEAALRTLKPGSESTAVTEIVNKVAENFECKAVEGMLSHRFEQNQLDSTKNIILNPNDSQKKGREEATFEQGEVYGVDILVSSGEGKSKLNGQLGLNQNVRTTIYKKTNLLHDLKLKASRTILSDISSRFGCMAFNIRSLGDEKKARLGLAECIKHQLVLPYDILYEKEGEYVAQFMATVLLMPSGSLQVTSPIFQEAEIVSKASKSLSPELKTLVETPLRPVKAKK